MKLLATSKSRRRTPGFDRTYEELKLVIRTSAGPQRSSCFDRTYEELKHGFDTCRSIHVIRFDRTYEELKHFEIGLVLAVFPERFDRTYEELKRGPQ